VSHRPGRRALYRGDVPLNETAETRQPHTHARTWARTLTHTHTNWRAVRCPSIGHRSLQERPPDRRSHRAICRAASILMRRRFDESAPAIDADSLRMWLLHRLSQWRRLSDVAEMSANDVKRHWSRGVIEGRAAHCVQGRHPPPCRSACCVHTGL